MTIKHLLILACALVLLGAAALATGASAATITSGTYTIPAVGGTVSVPVVLDTAPNGLIAAEYTVTLSNAAVADITGFTPPAWASITTPSTFPGPTTSFTVRMVDFTGTGVPLGAANLNVGTLRLTGKAIGTSSIVITPSAALGFQDRDANIYSVTSPQGTVTVTAQTTVPTTIVTTTATTTFPTTPVMTAASVTTGTFAIPGIGGTVSVPVVLNSAPKGLIGAEYTVTLSNAAVADITGFTSPAWASITTPSTFPGPTTSFTVRMVDFTDTGVSLGAANVNVGTLRLTGKAIGTSSIVITPSSALGFQDRDAHIYSVIAPQGTVTVSGGTPPTIGSITPNSGTQGSSVAITNLAGTGFKSGATVRFTRTGSADITATSVIAMSSSKITCQVALPWTAAAGTWNVVVTNPDGMSATLTNGFVVIAIPPAVFRFAPSSIRMPVGTTNTTTLYLDELITGFSGVDATLTLSLPDSTVGEIVGVTLPGWAMTSSSTLPSDTVSIRAVDLNNIVGPGGTALIGTITVRGDRAGSTALRVAQARVDDENGNTMPILLAACTVDVIQLPVIPGGSGFPPQDQDGDGRYDDVNGNGRADFADIVLFFNQMSWIEANEPIGFFDYNHNGRIDFADIVWLFNNLGVPIVTPTPTIPPVTPTTASQTPDMGF